MEQTRNDDPYIQYMYSYPHKTAYGSLQGFHFAKALEQLEEHSNNSLYIHIPFCQYKCGYCNLFSVTGQNEAFMEQYILAMERQASQLQEVMPHSVRFMDLTVGGGTPLILSERLLSRVLDLARNYFSIPYGTCPVVIETSPNQTTEKKLRLLRSYGVTRLSIGVQSFQNTELEQLHRYHTQQSAQTALETIRRVGFPCTNIDLIYGIPGQTPDSLQDSLQQALLYKPEELFVYPLYVKKGTSLYQAGIKRSDMAAQLYHCAVEYLKENGYIQVSMRRFVRSDYAAQQVEEPCGFGNTLSIGCGGRSYLGNLHFCTPYTVGQKSCYAGIKQYIEQKDFLTADDRTVCGYILSQEEQKRRYAVKNILFGNGIDRADYREHFVSDVQEDFPMIRAWCQKGYAKVSETHIMLTEEGLALSDYLGPQFISSEVAERMKQWQQKQV